MEEHDLIIVGAGVAGLTAGLYAARSRIDTILIEKMAPGGQTASTLSIENYPGFDEGVTGPELMERMHRQALKFGLTIRLSTVSEICLEGKQYLIKSSNGDYLSKAVIFCAGVQPNILNVPGEDRLRGRGVSYCATCDGNFFTDREVAVIGGGDSAVDEGLYLTRLVSRLHLIHRRDQLRAEKILQEELLANPKATVHWDSVVTSINGENMVESLSLENVKTGEESTLDISGVFIYVGLKPNTDAIKCPIKTDKQGFIITDDSMQAAPGFFVAGDVRSKKLRQIITAGADGAIAAFSADKYLENSR